LLKLFASVANLEIGTGKWMCDAVDAFRFRDHVRVAFCFLLCYGLWFKRPFCVTPLTFESHIIQTEAWPVGYNYTHRWLQCGNSQVQECQVQHMGNETVSTLFIRCSCTVFVHS